MAFKTSSDDFGGTAPAPDQSDEHRDIVSEAQKRFKRCNDWEQDTRKLFLEDLKFANGDSDNGYQWPNNVKKNRDVDARPTLTVNQIRQHNLKIINDAKQNKPGIAFRPTGDGATFEAAQALQALVRNIEYHSNAQVAYDTATKFQVEAGIGYIRVATDYADDGTFDQEIFIRRVNDPLGIFMDPDAKEADKSDSLFVMVFEEMDKDEYKEAYPKYADAIGQSALGNDDAWITDEKIRVCEYFRKVPKEGQLVAFKRKDTGETVIKKLSDLPKEMRQDVVDDPQTRKRTIWDTEVEWFLIAGSRIVADAIWPGKYIPIVPVIGEETIIEGRLDRKGHTRSMKDPQRMFNYWNSSLAEHVALQGKTPWIAPAQAIEEYEDLWNNANKVNYSVLMYNAIDDAGNPIPAPQRPNPPVAAPAYITGVQLAAEQMMQSSGQYQAQMGEQGNERSGKAIQERQRQGDNATYHYIDNLAIAIRQVGKIVLDLIPKIYDTKRVIMAMAEDGQSYEIEIDPKAKEAWMGEQLRNAQVAKRVLNPTIGKYDVQADVGPAYATKREEAFNAFTLILTQAPQLASVIGDILLRAGDFPYAQEASERLKRMVPPQALGTGPTVMEQQLQQRVTQLTELLKKEMDKGAEQKLKLTGKDQLRDIEAYDSETKRIAALSKLLPEDQAAVHSLIVQLVNDALMTKINEVTSASAPGLAAAAGVDQPTLPNLPLPPGARVGANGQLYRRDFASSKQYLPIGGTAEQV